MSFYISVCGNICSGKSTVAKLISKKMNFTFIPKNRIEMTFLLNFFREPQRWFLDTQLSFLISKAIEIKESLDQNKNIVVDRSIIEDIEIFSQYWIKKYSIDKEIESLYNNTAIYIKDSLPSPDLYIYCDSQIKTIEERFTNRPKRSFEKHYPKTYLKDLDKLYKQWEKRNLDVPFIRVDTEINNFTRQNIANRFIKEFHSLITSDQISTQIDLFSSDYEINQIEQEIIDLSLNKIPFTKHQPVKLERQRLQIYIAAPFTVFATDDRLNTDLFSTDEYGIIPENYQNILLSIESYFKKLGFDTFIPHRDVNNWGKTPLSSQDVFSNIIQKIEDSDILFGIPAQSIGVHLEVGIALSLAKQVIICDVEELKSSFFVEGMTYLEEIYSIKCSKLSDIVEQLKKNKIINIINLR